MKRVETVQEFRNRRERETRFCVKFVEKEFEKKEYSFVVDKGYKKWERQASSAEYSTSLAEAIAEAGIEFEIPEWSIDIWDDEKSFLEV